MSIRNRTHEAWRYFIIAGATAFLPQYSCDRLTCAISIAVPYGINMKAPGHGLLPDLLGETASQFQYHFHLNDFTILYTSLSYLMNGSYFFFS